MVFTLRRDDVSDNAAIRESRFIAAPEPHLFHHRMMEST
jgi:hypothetical protein